MIKRTDEMLGCVVVVEAEEIGTVSDMFIDDLAWRFRFLVVQLNQENSDKCVVIPMAAARQVNWESRRIWLNHSREELEKSPSLPQFPSETPLRDSEIYKQFEPLWVGETLLIGPHQPDLSVLSGNGGPAGLEPKLHEVRKPQLRTVKEMLGYTLDCVDGEAGKVGGFAFSPIDWCCRYVVVDIGGWLPGNLTLVATEWLLRLDWAQVSLKCDLEMRQVENAPKYVGGDGVGRELERQIYQHHRRKPYWHE